MKKFILITLVGLLIFGFTFAQTTQVDVNVLNKIIELLQNLIKTSTPSPVDTSPSLPSVSLPSKPCKPRPACLDATPPCMIPEPVEGWCPASGSSLIPSPAETKAVPLPKGVSPAVPLEKPITPEVIRPILPDENREDDVIVQLNNLRITRIVTSTPFLTSDTRAVFFAVRDVGWRCLMFESEEASTGMPCLMNLRRSIVWKELAIKITNDTILLQRNRQRAKLEDFQVNDKINVYGFMDKDNYGIETLIIRKLGTKFAPLPKSIPSPKMPLPKPTTSFPKSPEFVKPSICLQVITPAYNPRNPSECKEFPTPCDVPRGWVKTDKCPVSNIKSRERNGCKIGGCSSQICGEKNEDLVTTCEWRPEYECYKIAICERQSNGKCGWTITEELQKCLEQTKTNEFDF